MNNPANLSNIRYILYARKSTEEEERQILSIVAQVRESHEFAEKENLNVIENLTESKTAKIPGRKIFDQMISQIEKGDAQGIISWHPDRLARNAVDAGKIIHLLDTGKLLDLKFPSFWFQNSPQGIFMLQMAFGQSKYYIDSLSENTKRGLREKVRNGIFPSHAPIGYLNDKINKTIIIDPEKGKIIEQLFLLYSKGIYTFDSMSRFLFQNNIRSLYGNPIHKNCIKAILSNPFYYGHFKYAGEVHEGKHPPLISKKLWDKVQDVMKEKCWKRKENHNYPFTGLMKCGECGYSITAEQKVKHYKKRNRTQVFKYYRCSKKSKTQKCYQPFIRESLVVDKMRYFINRFSLPKGYAKEFLANIDKEKREQKVDSGIFVNEKEKEMEKISQKIDILLDRHLDGVISREELSRKKSQLLSRKRSIEEEIFSLQNDKNSWLGPFRDWVLLCQEAENLSCTRPHYHEMRDFLKRSGSDLILKDKKIRCDWPKYRPLVHQRPTSRNPAAGLGFEPR